MEPYRQAAPLLHPGPAPPPPEVPYAMPHVPSPYRPRATTQEAGGRPAGREPRPEEAAMIEAIAVVARGQGFFLQIVCQAAGQCSPLSESLALQRIRKDRGREEGRSLGGIIWHGGPRLSLGAYRPDNHPLAHTGGRHAAPGLGTHPTCPRLAAGHVSARRRE